MRPPALLVERRRRPARVLIAAGVLAVVVVMLIGGATVGTGVIACNRCHAMSPYVSSHSKSPHSQVPCSKCHSGAGLVASMAAGPRGLGWVAAAVVGATVQPVTVGDAPCRGCHSETLVKTVTVSGLRVRHKDFSERRCTECHAGTGHRLPGSWYLGPQMQDCTTCHRTSSDSLEACGLCHVGRTDDARSPGDSVWRSLHGAKWAKTHGMGDVKACIACHPPSYCARCHGVAIPHPVDWSKRHGAGATGATADACIRCHRAEWCTRCHGVQMPHPAGFLPNHGTYVPSSGAQVCTKCHSQRACDQCHYLSSHPNVPGVNAGVHGKDPR